MRKFLTCAEKLKESQLKL